MIGVGELVEHRKMGNSMGPAKYARNVYIDCWEADIPAGELAGKLRKRELYRELQLRHLEINSADLERLDEVLGHGLLAFGIRC